ncbi:GNAT family N-acetyltransferase [Corynebacterium sp. A21]|uniref:GNAT family N-acetyltransferase n=1 Tax=Corynebacterium sp. A21 TaxID=3457318 RepID=UPI003FCF6D28
MTIFYAVSNLADLSSLEVHRLYKLRVDIFVHEQLTAYAEIEDIDAAEGTMHVLAWNAAKINGEVSRELVGASRLHLDTFAGDEVVRLGRIAVTSTERGTGLAAELIENSLRFAAERAPGKDVIISAQSPLQSYYEGYGFEVCGEAFDDSGVAHLPMKLNGAILTERFPALAAI